MHVCEFILVVYCFYSVAKHVLSLLWVCICILYTEFIMVFTNIKVYIEVHLHMHYSVEIINCLPVDIVT